MAQLNIYQPTGITVSPYGDVLLTFYGNPVLITSLEFIEVISPYSLNMRRQIGSAEAGRLYGQSVIDIKVTGRLVHGNQAANDDDNTFVPVGTLTSGQVTEFLHDNLGFEQACLTPEKEWQLKQ